jgi:hypothetical protein
LDFFKALGYFRLAAIFGLRSGVDVFCRPWREEVHRPGCVNLLRGSNCVNLRHGHEAGAYFAELGARELPLDFS